jgi:mannosyltransferase OCH1-like enzyme
MASLLIPKVFHQIWLGPKPLPDKFKEWADKWLALNPGWKMDWWTDEHLPEMSNKKEFDAADKMAAKSDILRYDICHRYGGIYIDSDLEPLRPIEDLLDGVNAFYGDERPHTPCNAILGCAKNDPFFGRLVEQLPASFAGEGDIVDKTGPRFLKRELDAFLGENAKLEWDHGQKRRHRHASADNTRQVFGYDWRTFYPYYYTEEQREWDTFPDAYARHHWTASWWKNGGV